MSAGPRIVALFGDPVEHSRSPAMHNAAFRALGLDWVYVAHRVPPAELGAAIAAARLFGYAGLNVTVPHKEAVVPHLDDLGDAARSIGAVNTVVRRGGRLVGENTDADGFLRALRRLRFRFRERTALVLGAGGSARAVVWALGRSGLARLVVLNRTVSRAEELRSLLPAELRGSLEAGPLEAALDRSVVSRADLIVNCTSLGLDGRSMPPLALDATRPTCLVYDLVYGRRSTPLVARARRLGRRAEDGRRMLLEQAGLAFRLWTGRRPPLAAMARALEES